MTNRCPHCKILVTESDHICAESVAIKTDERLYAEMEAEIEMVDVNWKYESYHRDLHYESRPSVAKTKPPKLKKYTAIVTRITVEKYTAIGEAESEALFRERVMSDDLFLEIEPFENDTKVTIGAMLRPSADNEKLTTKSGSDNVVPE